MVFRKAFSKKKAKLKEYIKLSQYEEKIYISGVLSNPNYEVKALWLNTVDKEEKEWRIFNQEKNNKFKFEIDLQSNWEILDIDDGIYKLYLIVNVHENQLSEKQKLSLKLKPTTKIDELNGYYEYPIRLGRFNKTETEIINPTVINEKRCELYKTVKGNLAISINKPINQAVKTQIDYLKSKKHEIILGGKLFTRNQVIENIQLLVTGRENNIKTYFNLSNLKYLEDATIHKFGLNRYKYKIIITLNTLFENKSLDTDVYDLFFEIKFRNKDEKELIRIGKPRFRARYYLKSSSGIRGNKVFAVSPYYTVKKFNLSFQAEEFEQNVYIYMKRLMRWTWLLRPLYRKKNIWIVGERPYKAQDTGFRFFEYMRKNHKEHNCYYVIESDSPELSKVESLGNALYYKSKKHVKYVLMARRIIGSHHPDYLYPLRTDEFIKKVKAKKIFIQHGILGTKNLEHFYSKNSPSFSTDLFLVSSDFEKQIVINDLGYNPDEVVVTGLSRFDSLFERDVETKRQLLIIPTWREWLVREDEFLQSKYFDNYKNLINNSKLHELAKKHNFEIVYCLHPNMQKYSYLFGTKNVKVINQGEIDVQFLLKQSAMMITDYSSVAFDFSFLNKPVIYFQFDRKEFFGSKGSHMDLDNDLPGEIVFTIDEILNKVQKYAENNFHMEDEYRKRASKFLKYNDQNSSKRIYDAVKSHIPKKSIFQKIEDTELYHTLFNIFRKSKYYFPLMKTFYNVARILLPVDKKLILFESGVGKQYADSPRYIYEEIVHRNLNYTKIWVSNKNIRFTDVENTKRIKRLSPSYFYYLARAGFWVNNQNFPTYIRKPKNTIYIQTWHGTPLKKMLHDIENVMGRTDDYVKRVTKAIQNWDYLISPSEYASKAFKSAFKYNGEILEIGYPRNDIFYKNNKDKFRKDIFRRLNLPENKKIILYAPTFRDNQVKGKNKFSFDIQMDLEQMKRKLGEEYILLLRMHVVIKNKIKLDPEIIDFVYDVSEYSEIQELLLITDILITDYSSVMFDFANTRKPMLFYTYDFKMYRDIIRGFYMDFEEEAPGPFVQTTDEIIDSIRNIDLVKQRYQKKYNQFIDKHCYLEDGKSSERIVELLFNNSNDESSN